MPNQLPAETTELDPQRNIDAQGILYASRLVILNVMDERVPPHECWAHFRSNPLISSFITDSSIDEVSLRQRFDAIVLAAQARDLQREELVDLETIRAILFGEAEGFNCKPWNSKDLGVDNWEALEPRVRARFEELLRYGKIELGLQNLPVRLSVTTVHRLASGITSLTKRR